MEETTLVRGVYRCLEPGCNVWIFSITLTTPGPADGAYALLKVIEASVPLSQFCDAHFPDTQEAPADAVAE